MSDPDMTKETQEAWEGYAEEMEKLKADKAKLHKVIAQAREITCHWANSGVILPYKVSEFNHDSRLDVLEGAYKEEPDRAWAQYKKHADRITNAYNKLVNDLKAEMIEQGNKQNEILKVIEEEMKKNET